MLNCNRSLCILDEAFIEFMHYEYFLASSDFLLHFLKVLFHRVDVFSFSKAEFISFSFPAQLKKSSPAPCSLPLIWDVSTVCIWNNIVAVDLN